jgi:hypothetical protein
MARLRVKSGTGCGAVAQEHAARISIDLVCLGCRLQPPPGAAPPSWAPMFACGGALDVSEPNQTVLAAGMGKPTRNELLSEYYLRAAGVAAVWIDATDHVGAQDVASVEID